MLTNPNPCTSPPSLFSLVAQTPLYSSSCTHSSKDILLPSKHHFHIKCPNPHPHKWAKKRLVLQKYSEALLLSSQSPVARPSLYARPASGYAMPLKGIQMLPRLGTEKWQSVLLFSGEHTKVTCQTLNYRRTAHDKIETEKKYHCTAGTPSTYALFLYLRIKIDHSLLLPPKSYLTLTSDYPQLNSRQSMRVIKPLHTQAVAARAEAKEGTLDLTLSCAPLALLVSLCSHTPILFFI